MQAQQRAARMAARFVWLAVVAELIASSVWSWWASWLLLGLSKSNLSSLCPKQTQTRQVAAENRHFYTPAKLKIQ